MEGGAIEDAGLGAVDEHAPESKLANDLVQRSLADQKLFHHIAYAVERSAEQGEKVSFDLVPA